MEANGARDAYAHVFFNGAVAPLGSSLSQRQTVMKPSFTTVFLAKRLVSVDLGQGYSRKRTEPSM